MRLRGLHHVTAICSDLDRTIAFYRDTLGLGIVNDGYSPDDPGARHVWFGTEEGTFVSFLHYPELPQGVDGVGSVHHFALRIDSAAELHAWRDYLHGRGCNVTQVLDRGAFHSIYVRDPDGHVVEIATRGGAIGAGEPPA